MDKEQIVAALWAIDGMIDFDICDSFIYVDGSFTVEQLLQIADLTKKYFELVKNA